MGDTRRTIERGDQIEGGDSGCMDVHSTSSVRRNVGKADRAASEPWPGIESTRPCRVLHIHSRPTETAGPGWPRGLIETIRSDRRLRSPPSTRLRMLFDLPCQNPVLRSYPPAPKIPPSGERNSNIAAGPSRMINSDGKISRPIGKIILIGARWASSSAICRRRTRI